MPFRPFRSRRVLATLALFAVATVAGLWFASQVKSNPSMSHMVPWDKAIAVNLTYYYVWAALVPLVVALGRRWRFEGGRWPAAIAVHAAASAALAAASIFITEAILTLLDVRIHPLGEILRSSFATNWHSLVPTYWLILAGFYAVDYHVAARDRELRASQLEARLAEARLQTLRMQLQPHFLFNTLHSISALMYSDVAAADTMMTRLADLLRTTLESDGTPEVTLARELELVRRYVDIELVRFEDRLRMEVDVPAEALAVRVPALVLQPLVENALRHGIERLPEGGGLRLDAERADGRLRLCIVNDGPAGRGEEEPGMRLGLANTRERLAQLYGADWRLALEQRPEGGAVVTLEVPWRTA